MQLKVKIKHKIEIEQHLLSRIGCQCGNIKTFWRIVWKYRPNSFDIAANKFNWYISQPINYLIWNANAIVVWPFELKNISFNSTSLQKKLIFRFQIYLRHLWNHWIKNLTHSENFWMTIFDISMLTRYNLKCVFKYCSIEVFMNRSIRWCNII